MTLLATIYAIRLVRCWWRLKTTPYVRFAGRYGHGWGNNTPGNPTRQNASNAKGLP